MAKSLSALIEDLKLVSLGPLSDSPVRKALIQLAMLLNGFLNNPALEELTPEEYRSFKSFWITVNKIVTMTENQIAKHVDAHWRGKTSQALAKLPIGPQVRQYVDIIKLGYE